MDWPLAPWQARQVVSLSSSVAPLAENASEKANMTARA
jgi:hypothetical protein